MIENTTKEFYKYQSNLPDEDLIRLAFFNIRKTKKEARKSAKSILKERNLSTQEINEYKDSIKKLRRRELNSKESDYSILDIIIDIFCGGYN